MQPTNINAAILARVSSKTDRQDYTRQVRDLTSICEANGWHIVATIKAKVSATKTRLNFRKDIQELIKLVDAKKINKVVVTEITRIGRNAKEIRQVIDYLHEHGVYIYIHSLGLDTDDPDPMKKAIQSIILTILSEFAEMEIMMLSKRIKSGLQAAKAKGKRIGRQTGETEDFAKKNQREKRIPLRRQTFESWYFYSRNV